MRVTYNFELGFVTMRTRVSVFFLTHVSYPLQAKTLMVLSPRK